MHAIRRRLSLVLAAAVCLAAAGAPAQQPPFRGAVDLIAVDVQVVDREGRPVTGITADKFTVTIDTRKRRVVSADLIDYRAAARTTPSTAPAEAANGLPPTAPVTTTAAPGRVMMLAVDCLSFDVAVSRAVATGAKQFIERVPPQDRIGLFAFPLGPKIDPTTDRAAVIGALDLVVGQRDSPAANEFHLRPAELIDLSLWGEERSRILPALVVQLCGGDNNCRDRLAKEVKANSLYYEAQGGTSLNGLRSLLQNLGGLSGRKTVVLASAGIVASDVPGGRPDLRQIGGELGRVASESNVAIYTLFMDQGWLEGNAAETRRAKNTVGNASRDSSVIGRWLDEFTGSAGGALIKVMFGSGEFAFDRVLSETSAYYLLGVEVASDDRDGRAHEINVKVNGPDLTVRGRAWVTLPKTAGADAASDRARTSDPDSPMAAVRPRASTGPLASLVAAFERGDDAKVIAGMIDPVRLIRDYRNGRPFWADPRRDATFALELALAGLRGVDVASREEGAKLLFESNALIRQSESADAFECQWYLVQAAAFEGAWRPALTLPLIAQGRQRCPSEPRLALAHAILLEQQFPPGTTPTLIGRPGPVEDRAREREIAPAYEAAMASPATQDEARARAAWFFHRIGRADRARALVDQMSISSGDPKVRYLSDVIRGEVLRAQGEIESAAASFRNALAAWPGAQSARVALMTLLIEQGKRQEAETLAVQVQIAPPDQIDPWWLYWLGDYPTFAQRLAALRELTR